MNIHDESMSAQDYARLSELIYKEAGIALGTEKKTMLEARIRRRLKALHLGSFGHYAEALFRAPGLKDEIPHLIDVVTTNKTDFFREPRHFDFLTAKAVPELTACNRLTDGVLVWSAGCSSGEEPYTIAMVLSEYALTHAGFRFRILATDVSTIVLGRADRGVYGKDAVSPVPVEWQRRYFCRSRDPGSDCLRVSPNIRSLVEFRRLNFMDSDYGIEGRADVIFCRNVIIYFDRSTQERILGRLANHLRPGGYLFVGHAETLRDLRLPLIPVAPAIYRRTDA